MGMFDYVEVDKSWGLPDAEWQTKDTPNQYLDSFRIEADGSISEQVYETEDQSAPNAEGLMRLVGCMARVNLQRVQVKDYRGRIDFYSTIDDVWHEYSALFNDGKLIDIRQIAPTPQPTTEGE